MPFAHASLVLSLLLLIHLQAPNNADHHASPVTLARFGDQKNKFSFAGKRFLIYDVNRGEGFNLRRDVYMRVANAVRQLRDRGHNFVIVLPPWGNIWHWRRQQARIPWGELFDLESLSEFVPVIEFEEFMEGVGDSVDDVLYLQHYAEGWSESEGYVLKYDLRPCIDADKYYRRSGEHANSTWRAAFFGYGDSFYANNLNCLSIQGQSSTLAEAITRLLPTSRSILVDRAEVILHDRFGDFFYWKARKSMRYAEYIRRIGDAFRAKQFNSTDKDGSHGGGNYLCVHLRRGDLVWAHREDIPSIKGAAHQVITQATKLGLRNVFLSTDANHSEVDSFCGILANRGIQTTRFVDETLLEAVVSIVDQYVCAHSKHFIGSHLSTFSFRIHEDREILGFTPETTFNRLCPDNKTTCEQPAKWEIVNDPNDG